MRCLRILHVTDSKRHCHLSLYPKGTENRFSKPRVLFPYVRIAVWYCLV
jgi:hypothetical protein